VDTPTAPPEEVGPSKSPTEIGALGALFAAVRNRIIGGLVAALPIAITFGILWWLYSFFRGLILPPFVWLVVHAIGTETVHSLPDWWENLVAPALATVLVLVLLYCLGWFVRSRFHRAVDWVLLHLPVVTVVYKAVRNVFESMGGQGGGASRFKRVVLVSFPHPGTKVAAFVIRTIRDEKTQKPILCVYVPASPMPTSGYVLFVPEEEVTELDWTVNDTLQSYISVGLAAPPIIQYFDGRPATSGELLGADGQALIVPRPPSGEPAQP
jgi:uncharacterized membrane protein